MPQSNKIEFAIPPDGEISDALLSKIKQYENSRKPLIYLARMRRLPYGFLLYLSKEIKNQN